MSINKTARNSQQNPTSTAKMKILFLCTAHNSLSQSLFLTLTQRLGHEVTVEYAISDEVMIEAAALAQPNLIICPFLTTKVPSAIYNSYLTLIVHPGPPGDAGPSAIDWLLLGDDGAEPDSGQLLRAESFSSSGRTHWGVTILQAVEQLDAGPVWAFEQFPIDINNVTLTKSTLYRGAVTRAATVGVQTAIDRILEAKDAKADANIASADLLGVKPATDDRAVAPFISLTPRAEFRQLSVTTQEPFRGGITRHRPFLSAVQREFDPKRHTALDISRRLRCGDSQPGCQSAIFGPKLYLYGGVVEDEPAYASSPRSSADFNMKPGSIVACRDEAVCISTCDKKGVWITHIRQLKTKADRLLWPKVPALRGLISVYGLRLPSVNLALPFEHSPATGSQSDLTCSSPWFKSPLTSPSVASSMSSSTSDASYPPSSSSSLSSAASSPVSASCTFQPCRPAKMAWESRWAKRTGTFQEVWVDWATTEDGTKSIAYVFFEFYNGAMSTTQCRSLLQALDDIVRTPTDVPLSTVALMGGQGYFSNGIHLSVIEAAADPAMESWDNICAINDVVEFILRVLPARGITSIATVRGNCAAGGVAMAAACDVVVAGEGVVLNPAYRSIGLHGSEFHTISYPGRCGEAGAKRALHDMMPQSARCAFKSGMVDCILPGHGIALEWAVRRFVERFSLTENTTIRNWKKHVDLSSAALSRARTAELGEMARDFWSPRSEVYHARRQAFVRKVKPSETPTRFATHRRGVAMLAVEEMHDVDGMYGAALPHKGRVGDAEELISPSQLHHYEAVAKPAAIPLLFPCAYEA